MGHKILALFSVVILLDSCNQFEKSREKSQNFHSDNVRASGNNDFYEDLNGNSISLSKFYGKKVLLNFWATWCRPCIEEMPSLVRSKAILEKENYVFLLASDESITEIKDFKKESNFNFDFIHFKGSLGLIGINALPTTFIYNEKGEKVDEITGAIQWDSQQTINRLRSVP